ncbi:MAG TPA: alpha/beta fold hydrolase [Phycisphaerales bacterium]|nr:alpha/beta fold hydrolase [Phycisphaerales bacterium]HRQ74713.1 alpha/beta fold hydrolase [Phycisphaerales bacterium]
MWRSVSHIALLLVVIILMLRLTGCMERMFYIPTVGPTPLAAAPRGTQEVWFNSTDSTRLYGWFIPSRLHAEGGPPAPTILHVHGNAGNIQSHTYFTEYLPHAGFNVFIFDYRGYGQSAGSAKRRNDLIADTHAALDAMLQRSDVDVSRIGLYGQSLGGAIGVNLMAERPEIKAAVIESAFTSWREIAASVVGGDPPNFIGRWLAALVLPDHARPIDAIARIERPMLLIHGDADSIIPVGHSRRLAAAAPDFAELLLLPGGDHNTLRDSHPEIDMQVVRFFRRHVRD